MLLMALCIDGMSNVILLQKRTFPCRNQIALPVHLAVKDDRPGTGPVLPADARAVLQQFLSDALRLV
jgi:hypothetical protein